MASRPYQHYSEAELLDLRRSLENSLKAVEREKQDYGRRAGGSYWEYEGYKEIEEKGKRIWSDVSAINQELAMRRSERMSAPSAPAGWYPDPKGQAPKRWWDGSSWTERTSP
jgi:hypothetical protein